MWIHKRLTRLRFVAGVGAIGLLMACCDGGRGSSAASSERFSPSDPKPLHLMVEAIPLTHGARLSGTTNLPDGTELMLSVSRTSTTAGERVAVSDGKFTQDLFPNGGKPIPPGDYEVEVMTPLGDLQPAAVKAQLGSDYEALTGPLLVKDDVGRVIEYKSKVRLDGPASASADRAARKKAYQEHVAFSERTCRSNPDTLEKLTGVHQSAEQRERSVANCLKRLAASRKELASEGFVEP